MNQEIKRAMEEAKMSPVMVMEQAEDFESEAAIEALTAMNKAENTGNAIDAANAMTACAKWIEKNEDAALQIIRKRILARAALAERDARPMTPGEVDKLLGM